MFSKNLLAKSNWIFQKNHLNAYNSIRQFKVAVLGASGSIGQPLSLLLKRSPKIEKLALHDIDPLITGVGVDLSHIPKRPVIESFCGMDQLKDCLNGSDITVVVAGKPRAPGMTRSDLFVVNAGIIAPIISEIGLYAPKSLICIITNPINSLVPMAASILQHVCHDISLKRLFGVTTIDSVRANTFVSRAKGITNTKVYVPVMGGHSESTLIPVISQTVPQLSFPPGDRISLTKRIQGAGTNLVELKAVGGSSTLAMAYAAEKFISALMEGASGTRGIVECSFVHSPESPCEFFATPLVLGPEGISRNLGIGNLIESELALLRAAIPELDQNIRLGKDYADDYIKQHLQDKVHHKISR